MDVGLVTLGTELSQSKIRKLWIEALQINPVYSHVNDWPRSMAEDSKPLADPSAILILLLQFISVSPAAYVNQQIFTTVSVSSFFFFVFLCKMKAAFVIGSSNAGAYLSRDGFPSFP